MFSQITKSIMGLSLMAPMFSFAAKPTTRSPSQACYFKVDSLVITSGSPVNDYDPKVDNIVATYPELKTDFGESLPKTVNVAINYSQTGCLVPLRVEFTVTPKIGSSKVDFDSAKAQEQVTKARSEAKFAAKPWIAKTIEVKTLKPNDAVKISDVEILKHFEATPEGKHPWAVNFAVKVFEKDRKVGDKGVTLESDLEP